MATDPTPASTENATVPHANAPQLRVRVDERNIAISYANSFRTNATAEEMMLDFGVNVFPTTLQVGNEAPPPNEVVFDARNRIFLNYYTAKRLALTLAQIVAQHESLFGELKLSAADRMQRKL